jgi:hypothetical protein
MNPQLLPATARDDIPAWQQTVVAFLAEKERRSGSRRTVEAPPGCQPRTETPVLSAILRSDPFTATSDLNQSPPASAIKSATVALFAMRR